MDYVYPRRGGGSGFAVDWQSMQETTNSPYLIDVKQFQGDSLSFITPSEGSDEKRENSRQGLSQRGRRARFLGT